MIKSLQMLKLEPGALGHEHDECGYECSAQLQENP